MVIPTREFTQVLGDGMNSLARTWRVLLPPTLLVSIPASIASILVFSTIPGAIDFLDVVLNSPERLQNLPADVLWELAQPFYTAAGLVMLVQLVTGLFISLVSHRAVADQLANQVMGARATAVRAVRRYPTALLAVLIAAVVIAGVISLGGIAWLTPLLAVGTPNPTSVLVAVLLFVVLIGPGLWAAVSVSMTSSVVAIEGHGAIDSLRRSIRLVRGRWWATTGFLLIVGLLGGIAIQMIQLIAFPLVGLGDRSGVFLVAAALGIFAQGVLVAGIAVMSTQWYVDLRSRRESLATSDLA